MAVLAVLSHYRHRCILTAAVIAAVVTVATRVLPATALRTTSIQPMAVIQTRTVVVVVVVIVGVVDRSPVTVHLAGQPASRPTDLTVTVAVVASAVLTVEDGTSTREVVAQAAMTSRTSITATVRCGRHAAPLLSLNLAAITTAPHHLHHVFLNLLGQQEHFLSVTLSGHIRIEATTCLKNLDNLNMSEYLTAIRERQKMSAKKSCRRKTVYCSLNVWGRLVALCVHVYYSLRLDMMLVIAGRVGVPRTLMEMLENVRWSPCRASYKKYYSC